MSYGGTVAFNAGVGEKARADARIILEGIKNTTTQTRTREANYVVWQKMVNQGSTAETLAMPSFTGPNKPVFSAPGGLTVQIPDGNFKSQIQTLSQQPGMSYLNDLAARKDVNWQPVKLAYDTWNYQQSGLTPAGAALLSVAVAWATAGQGAALMGTTGATTSAVANAAFSSLAAQASISFVNNKGDINKTLKELGSSQTVKATIAAALTAGVLDKLGATNTMTDLSKSTGFSEKLTYNLINATGRALTNTAINGGNLEDALKQALIGGIVDTAHGQVASQIKGIETQYLAHKLAHALAGCVAGAAAGGTCKDGAIGGAVGEIVAEMFKGQRPAASASALEIDAYNAKVLAYSKLVAGAVSAYAGGNAQTAITTAETAVKNNFLTDKQWRDMSQQLQACKGNTSCEQQVRQQYLAISMEQDNALKNACTVPTNSSCQSMLTNVMQGREQQANLVLNNQLPAMYLAGYNMQANGEAIAQKALARMNADILKAQQEKFTGVLSAGAYFGPGAEFALEYKNGEIVNVMWGFGAGLGVKLGKLDTSAGASTNIYPGIGSGDMKAGDVRLGILAGGTGSVGPGAIDLTLLNAGLRSNANGAKGTYYEALKIDTILTPKFEIGATGRVIVTWSYQKRS